MLKEKRAILINIFKTPFLRNILLVCFGISIIIFSYHDLSTIPAYTDLIIRNMEDEARRTASYLSDRLLPGNPILNEGAITHDLTADIQLAETNLGIAKLKIFSSSGETLYSTEQDDIGKTNKNKYFHEVVAKGNIYSKLVKKGSETADGEGISIDVVEIYIPLMKDSIFGGAFEIYYDISDRKKAMDYLSTQSLTIMLIIVFGLFAGIILSLYRASRSGLANDKATFELSKARDKLEGEVAERTSELRLANRKLYNQITRRNEAVQRSKHSEAKYRTLFENAGDAIFILEAEGADAGKIITANQAAAEMHGYTIDELKTLKITDLDTEEAAKPAGDRIARMLRGEWINAVITHRRKDETIFPVEISAGLVDYDGRKCILAFDRDVTEKAEADEEIRRNYEIQNVINRLLRLSLQSIHLDAILHKALELILSVPHFGFEPKGIIFLTNKETKTLVMTAHKGISTGIEEMCSEVPVGKCVCGQAAASGKAVFSNQLNDRHKIFDKDTPPHSHYAIPILFADEPLGVMTLYLKKDHRRTLKEEHFLRAIADTLAGLIVREQTREEKNKIENQLHQAQKMEAIGTLAGGIAHDFNNILSPLLGYTELLKADLPTDHPFQTNADIMLSSALRAKELVNQILIFSRKTESEIRPIKLQSIVKEAIKLLRSSIPKTINIEQHIDPNCGLVNADPTRIHQITMNLATNAYHAMMETGGELAVSLKQIHVELNSSEHPDLLPGEYARLSVVDTGVGMESDVANRMFEPYFTTKETGKGTGLGLAVVHGIVKESGGDISVYSEPGRGTDIQIYIPVIESKGGKKIESTGPIPGGTEKILLVDDEETVATMEKQMLQHLGYDVTVRTGSIDALEAFKANPDKYNIIVTDMAMPNMSGVQLARQIRNIKATIPIVICTGFSDQISDEKCQALDIQGYIMKPVVIRELAEIVRKVLDRSEESQLSKQQN